MMQMWSEPTPIVPEMTRLTLQIAGRCFFDSSLEKTDEIGEAFVEVMEVNQDRFRSVFSAPFGFQPSNQVFTCLNLMLKSQALSGQASGTENDLLSRLIEAFDAEDDPEQMTQQQGMKPSPCSGQVTKPLQMH